KYVTFPTHQEALDFIRISCETRPHLECHLYNGEEHLGEFLSRLKPASRYRVGTTSRRWPVDGMSRSGKMSTAWTALLLQPQSKAQTAIVANRFSRASGSFSGSKRAK